MRSTDGDEYTGFADFQSPQAVDDSNSVNGKFFVELLADFTHFLKRHGIVGLVLKIAGLAAVGFVANKTVESDDGAIEISAHMPCQGFRVDGLLHQFVDVVFS